MSSFATENEKANKNWHDYKEKPNYTQTDDKQTQGFNLHIGTKLPQFYEFSAQNKPSQSVSI